MADTITTFGIDYMNKLLIIALTLALPALAYASISKNHAEWVVPAGVTKINVKSYSKDGQRLMNYDFDVEPGQSFILTAK